MGTITIGDSCEVLNGYAFKSEKYTSSGIRVIRIANVQKGYIEDDSPVFYQTADVDLNKYMLRENDLLVSLTGNVGRTALLTKDMLPAALNQRVACLRLKTNKITRGFLFHLLNSDYFESKCIQSSQGVAQKNLSTEWLKSYDLPLYSLSKQNEITKILDNLRNTIILKEQEINKFDELIKARFIEMFGDVRENSNEFEIVQFNDIVEYMGDIGSNGANKVVVNHLDMKDEEDYAIMVRFTNFTKNDFKNDVKYVSKDAYDFFKKSQIFGGELIVCKIGSAGQNYVMPYLNRPVSLGLNQIMIRIKDTILMPYLYQYLHTDYGEFLISGCINGAVTKTITKTELKKIPILLPPMEFQQRFAEFVGHVDKSRFDIKKSIIELEREVVYD